MQTGGQISAISYLTSPAPLTSAMERPAATSPRFDVYSNFAEGATCQARSGGCTTGQPFLLVPNGRRPTGKAGPRLSAGCAAHN